MSNSGTIDTGQNPDLITHKVLVEGTELPKTYQVKSIAVSREINRIPLAQLVIIDGDASERDFKLSNEDVFLPGKKVEITVGYHSDEATIFKGIVIKHAIKIRSGASTLVIECKDEAVKMTLGRKSNYFYDSKDSDVFQKLIGNYGLQHDVEATNYQHKELVQYDSSDWDFMVSRAQANGKICFVENGKISIKKPDYSSTELETVTFGATILDFDAEIDARNQYKKVTAHTWNQADQKVETIEGADPAVPLNSTTTASSLADALKSEKLELRHGGNVNNVLMQDWADSKWLFQQLSKVRGRVKFQGIPKVLPNTMLKLDGVGNRFNGKVYVTGVFHHVDEGDWTVDAQFGMNPEWFSETFDIHANSASGLMPGIKGLHVGIVTQLEGDPEGEDRIQVKIPIINDSEKGIWCRVASMDAGKDRGSSFMPEINNEVIIGFINEDPNHAVVLGMMHSSANPSPIPLSDDNHQKGIITRSKMKLVFDDDKKTATLETPAGKSIVIDEDKDTITISDDHDNVIIMDPDGIKISTNGKIEMKAVKDVIIEGLNVNIKASAQLKAEGSAGAEVSSSAVAVLKGSLVQIN